MNDTVENQEVEKEVKPKIEILRGRMPLPLVRTIKFAHPDLNDSQVADMYRTTSGKVSDVRKGRNFGYIDESSVAFTEEQIAAATARIAELASDDRDLVKEAMSEAGIKVGTEEELAAFDEARQGSRKPRGKAAEKEDSGEEVAEAAEAADDADVPDESDLDGLDDLLS